MGVNGGKVEGIAMYLGLSKSGSSGERAVCCTAYMTCSKVGPRSTPPK